MGSGSMTLRVAGRGSLLLVLGACLLAPLACKSSDPTPQPPSQSEAGQGNPDDVRPNEGDGGRASMMMGEAGSTGQVDGGEPSMNGMGMGGAPTEPGAWDDSTWDNAIWQ